jgi:hypothetical protein
MMGGEMDAPEAREGQKVLAAISGRVLKGFL